jgi:glutathione peroxidase
MKKLKRFLLVLVLLIAAFAVYVEIVNRNSVNMTYRQKILKAVYPAFMWFTRLTGTNSAQLSNKDKIPPVPFYTLNVKLNNGESLDFSTLQGRKVLLVNTASDCGYTHQYEDLQALSSAYGQKLLVIGFPANDFKEQEKGTDEEIGAFCKKNYGVTFPLAQKAVVVKSASQHPVFQWLSDSAKNGWNNKVPSWNFSKYLVNEKGILTHYFDPSVSPTSEEVKAAINE